MRTTSDIGTPKGPVRRRTIDTLHIVFAGWIARRQRAMRVRAHIYGPTTTGAPRTRRIQSSVRDSSPESLARGSEQIAERADVTRCAHAHT